MNILSEPTNVFEITFTVDKDAALKAGKSRWGEVKVEIDPGELNEAERAILLRGINKLPWDRSAPGQSLVTTGNKGAPSGGKFAECTPEAVREAIAMAGLVMDWYDKEIAEREAKTAAENEANKEKRIAALLSNLPWSMMDTYRSQPVDPTEDARREWHVRSAYKDDPRIAKHLPEVERVVAEHNEQLNQTMRREIAEANAAAAAAKERRQAQIDAWVAGHGTPNQQARHKAGLLPEEEVLSGMRAQVFAGLDQFTRYEKLTATEVREELDCEPRYTWEGDKPKVEFWSEDAPEASAEEFETLETIKAALGDRQAQVTLREHVGEVEDHGRVVRRAVMVELQVGELLFSREYACPQPGE